MGIAFQCNNCGKSYKLRDEAAGKVVKCKECGNSLRVPKKKAEDEGGFLDGLDDLVSAEQSARRVGQSRNQQRRRQREQSQNRKSKYITALCDSCNAPHKVTENELGNSIHCTECGKIFEVKSLKGSRIMLGVAGLGVGIGLGTTVLILSESPLFKIIWGIDILLGLGFSYVAFFGQDHTVNWLMGLFEFGLRGDDD